MPGLIIFFSAEIFIISSILICLSGCLAGPEYVDADADHEQGHEKEVKVCLFGKVRCDKKKERSAADDIKKATVRSVA